MNSRIAKQAYDKGYDAGVRANKEPEYVAENPYQKSHSFYNRHYFWQLGCDDGWKSKPRKISEEEAHERERERVRALETFRSRVLDAFGKGHIQCDCLGLRHDDRCPLGELEVEADTIRQKDMEVTA